MALEPVVRVGEVAVGGGEPPLLLADIGTFFNKDLATGQALIDAIGAAGLGIVKAEVLHDPDICLDTDLEEIITSRDLAVSRESYRRVIARKTLALSDYERLFDHARQRGLKLALSVYDETGLRFALAQGAVLLKIASSNIVHKPLIVQAASAPLPVIIDTGKSTLEEIARAVRWFVDAGGTRLILEHSPDAPPAPVSRQNLGMMDVLRRAFGCPVGLSDHHAGDEMLYAAIALGASVVEKGVCPDELKLEQDLAHALPVGHLGDVAKKCLNVHQALGAQIPDLSAARSSHPARMGVVAARDLEDSRTLEPADCRFAFPALGVPVEHFDGIIGRRLRNRVPRGVPIRWSDLDPA